MMNNVGDKYTFYYIERHWTDDNGNPAAKECAKARARSDIKGTTFFLCKATYEIIEVYDGEREQ